MASLRMRAISSGSVILAPSGAKKSKPSGVRSRRMPFERLRDVAQLGRFRRSLQHIRRKRVGGRFRVGIAENYGLGLRTARLDWPPSKGVIAVLARQASAHCPPHGKRRRGAVQRGDPHCVGDGIGDGGEQGDRAGLAAALHAHRIGGAARAGEPRSKLGRSPARGMA